MVMELRDHGRGGKLLATALRSVTKADLFFVVAMLLVSVLAVLAGQSRWLSDIYASRAAQTELVQRVEDGVTVYQMLLACTPTLQADDCAATLSLPYMSDPASDSGNIGILLAQFNGAVNIALNGKLIEDMPERRNMLRLAPMRPVLLELPADSLHEGQNQIDLTVSSSSALGGYLSTVIVGDMSVLSRHFETSLFWSQSVPLLFGAALLPIALLAVFLGWRHREAAFLVCGVVCLGFCVSTLYDVLPGDTPAGTLQGVRLLRTVPGALIGAFIFLIAGLRHPVSIPALCSYIIFFFLIWLLAQTNFAVLVQAQLFWMVTILMLLHAIITVAVQTWRGVIDSPAALLLTSAFGLFMMILNFLNIIGLTSEISPFLRGYGASFFVLLMSLELVKRFSDKTVRLERSNQEMQDAIVAATRSLQQSHARAEAQRRSLLIQGERQRLMGDLHDGLAGSLISIQALSDEGESASLPQIHDLANRALLDLRLVVESLDSFEGDLAAAIAAFRERIMPQFSDPRFKIHWDIAAAPTVPNLSPEVSLAIFRILQEAISNARRHGGANNIWIRAHALKGAPQITLITVRDDGLSKLPVLPGFGMRNMSRRAQSFGGTIRYRFTKRGTVVSLRFGGVPRASHPRKGGAA